MLATPVIVEADPRAVETPALATERVLEGGTKEGNLGEISGTTASGGP